MPTFVRYVFVLACILRLFEDIGERYERTTWTCRFHAVVLWHRNVLWYRLYVPQAVERAIHRRCCRYICLLARIQPAWRKYGRRLQRNDRSTTEQHDIPVDVRPEDEVMNKAEFKAALKRNGLKHTTFAAETGYSIQGIAKWVKHDAVPVWVDDWFLGYRARKLLTTGYGRGKHEN